jgi:hypothetical protein
MENLFSQPKMEVMQNDGLNGKELLTIMDRKSLLQDRS